MSLYLLSLISLAYLTRGQCPDYIDYSQQYHAPFSSGRYNLSYQRPNPACRSFSVSAVEDTITRISRAIADPDLARLFENAYPNTLDTAIKWKGYANNGSDEELTFIITGDINAMWLRDSANQLQSYLPLLTPSTAADSLASLYRGVINLQARYLLTAPYCQAFQPPVESGLPLGNNTSASQDTVKPPYNNGSVFECKYELDSLAAFFQVSSNYYTATQDVEFFKKYRWADAARAVLGVANAMMTPTYAADGRVNDSPYTFSRVSNRASETLENDGAGNPVQNGTGLVRSAFRPSDDATIYQLFIPANMMFSRYLQSAAAIAEQLGDACSGLAAEMKSLSATIRAGIEQHGVVHTMSSGKVYAFEVDGFGSQNIMDDANIPSLLSAPVLNYTSTSDPIYRSTRDLILSRHNSYFMTGPVISSIGGPHNGPGYAWPMASIVRILTSDDDDEIADQLRSILSSTDGLGLIHESINTFNVSDWTRQWFSWANGLFGQMIVDLSERKPQILQLSFQ